MPELFIGLMSGTSLDAVDAALVDFSAQPPRAIAVHQHPIADDLRTQLLALCHGESADELRRMGELDVRMGELFAATALQLLKQAGIHAADVRAIGSHGQTVRHEPHATPPFTLQIGDPNIIAQRTGITTVADFRRRDLAVGGQGAPLVPAFHAARLRAADEDRVALNIGGMANITVLPRAADAPVRGFDTGPGNALMDAWTRRHLGASHDAGGRWAASTAPHAALLEALLNDAYFHQPPPKSTGREHFNPAWLDEHLRHLHPSPDPAQVQASLCALTAASIADAILQHAPRTQRVLVCGGGVHNTTLLNMLAARLRDISVESTQRYGLDPDWVEALAFAWLAKQTLEGRPGNLPGVTGARAAVVLGGIYPGTPSPSAPLPLAGEGGPKGRERA